MACRGADHLWAIVVPDTKGVEYLYTLVSYKTKKLADKWVAFLIKQGYQARAVRYNRVGR